MARLTEPFIEFFRYLPAPAFGALAVAVLGIDDAPKIAIIFIGTFFQQVLVVANTTRRLDPALLEAAQTLGAKPRQLLLRVVVPGIITDLYSDMRVLLGWAWTYLIVAELIGVSSGITFFINQQAKYRAYDRVFASIIMIGAHRPRHRRDPGVDRAADSSRGCAPRAPGGSRRRCRCSSAASGASPRRPVSTEVTDEAPATVSAGEVAS